MAKHPDDIKAMQISLPPNDILINVARVLKGRVNDLTREVDADTTCNKAISYVQSILKDRDLPLRLNRIRTPLEKQKLRELALSINDPNQPSGSLGIRNATPLKELPKPSRATQEERKILKEDFLKDRAPSQPFVMTPASLQDKKLATVPGCITLGAIDAEKDDPPVEIDPQHCLWDTGAPYCSISADLVTNVDPSFLDLTAHDPYRTEHNISVQVDAVVALSNKTIQISTIFIVLPTSAIPNRRSGVILGQHGFLDKMIVETIPRSIILKRGQQIEDTLWGEIHLKALLNIYDELQEFS